MRLGLASLLVALLCLFNHPPLISTLNTTTKDVDEGSPPLNPHIYNFKSSSPTSRQSTNTPPITHPPDPPVSSHPNNNRLQTNQGPRPSNQFHSIYHPDPSSHYLYRNGDRDSLVSTLSSASFGPDTKNFSVRDLKTEQVNEKKKQLTVGYLTAVKGELKDRQGRTASGAITMAIDEINNDPNILPNVTLVLRWYDTLGDTVIATRAMTDMICDGVAAFFGPEGTCHVEAIVAQARNIPMISYKCSDYKASEVPTFARTEPPDTQVTKSVIALLDYYKWNKFSIIYEEAWQTVAQSLQVEAKLKNMTINDVKVAKDPHKCCVESLKCCNTAYGYQFINETKNQTRIYVFFGSPMYLVELMDLMQTAQLFEHGEYIVIYADMNVYSEKEAYRYLWKLDTVNLNKTCNDMLDFEMFKKRAQSLFVVVPTAPTDNYENFTKKVREYNTKAPFHFITSEHLNTFQSFVPIYAAYLFDSVKLYASALHHLLQKEPVINDKIIEDVASNGTKVIETIIEINHTYTSITGAVIKLDKNGDSEGNFSVLAFRDLEHNAPVRGNFYCRYQMRPVGQFFQNDEGHNTFPQYKINANTPMLWAGGDKPNDEPSCGFQNELCPKPNTHLNSIIAAGVLAILLFCAFVITMSVYRKWKIEQEIEGLLWKIDKNEILQSSYERGIVSSPSRQSLASASVTSYESRGGWQVFATTAQYRGVVVRIKELTFSRKKDISRDVMKEMRLLRELRHDNVNSFIGACVEPNKLYLVTDYCAKGSLYDIIENEDIKLDNMFIASLVHDLIKGMLYLHNSMLQVHGNLKSSNCVVTSRWVLQVTDFGLAEMRHCAENDSIGEHQYYRSLFWKAPEILRNPTLYIKGTQKGDVYAFAIILFEILGRRGPFGITGYEPKEIIEMVKHVPTDREEPFRPDTELLSDIGCDKYVLQCMKDCWAENPEGRPEFAIIRSRLKRMKDGKNKNIMDQMMDMMVSYANNLEEIVNERTKLLYDEKKKTEDLLHRMLPKPVAERLTRGYGIEPESFEMVTIYFSDIVGFTAMSAESTPLQVVNFLNDLYTVFDRIIKGYDVYKVETIGDAYMVVSGLPIRNDDRHAGEIASMAIDLLSAVKNHCIAHRPTETLKLRIGIHTGPVVAGVVGLTMPRYCLFGDTVNTASRMESNGEPLKIHISLQCKEALDKLGGYLIEERGLVNMKGKGEVRTFWLTGATDQAIQKREVDLENLEPLFCRPRRSPKLNNESRNPSICGFGGYGGLHSRRHSSVPRDPGGSKLTINTAFGSQNIDHGGEETRRSLMPRRVLSSIASSSDEHNRSQCMLNKVRESKSLDPLPVVRNNKPIDLIGQFLRVPRRPTKSLENCDKCGDNNIQIIALPEDKMINNNFPNGNLANISLISDDNYAEDAQSPLLNPTTQPAPAIIRRRGGSGFEEPVENDASKRWRSLESVPATCDNVADDLNKKALPRTSLKTWLEGLFSGNGIKSSNSSLRKNVLKYNNLQAERESIV